MRKNFCFFSFLLLFGSLSFAQVQTGGTLFTSISSPAFGTFQTALKHRDLGEVTKARELFDKAIQQDPGLAVAHAYRASYSSSPQEYVAHLAKAKEALTSAGEWEKLVYEFFETFLKNDLEKRQEIAQKMVASFPDKPRAYLHLSEVYGNLDQTAKEREILHKAVALDPFWPGTYVALTNSYLFGTPKDFRQADIYASKLVSMAPSAATYTLQGDVFRAQNNLAGAEELYTKAISLDASTHLAFYKRGHVNTFLGNFDQARADYDRAGKLDAVPTLSRNFIAFTYLYNGKPDKALQSLLNDVESVTAGMDAAKANTVKNSLLSTAADIAAHQKNSKKLEKIIHQIQPLSEELSRQVGTEEGQLNHKAGMLFWNGLLKTISNDFTGALQAAEEMKGALSGIKNPRRMEDYPFLLGMIALHQKDFQTAAGHFQKLSKQDIYGQYLLAKAYEGAGSKEKAGPIYKELSQYNFNNIGYALIRNEVIAKAVQ